MRLHARIFRFLRSSAWELLLPDIIDKPLKLVQNFYRHFLAADPCEKLELLREAENLSDAEVNELAEALAVEWKPLLQDGELNNSQRELLRQLVRSLHAAGRPAASDPNEALRHSLNASVLAGAPQALARVVLKPEQQEVGRSLFKASLMERGGGRGPRPLPADTPRIPGYRLLRVLGDGGFSVVYLASHAATGELRALKVGPLDDPARFRREVRTLSSLSGPHVVRYHEHGELPGHFWIAMEYLGDFTLADLIHTRPTTEQALLLAEQVLRGLETLHRAGIIHRDLKPDNAVVDNAFALRLIDFGLAKPLPGSPAVQTMSVTAGLVGTPRYMSPEQFGAAKALSYAADLWAFGCILFELLTGEALFAADNVMALGHEIMTKPIQLDRPEVPQEARAFLGRCLERDPARRWRNAGEALIEFAHVFTEVRRQLRHERSRESWGRVLEKRLLEGFAAAHKGQLTPGAAAEFVALARQEGALEVDKQQLNEVLPPVFRAQQRVFEAEQELVRAKQQLQDAATRLAWEELARQTVRIAKLGEALRLKQQELRRTVEQLLAEKVRSRGENERRTREAEHKRQEQKGRVRQQRRRKLLFAGKAIAVLVTLLLVGWGLYWGVATVVSAIRGKDEILPGHFGTVESVAFSPDGTRIALGSDNTVKVWDPQTGHETLTLKGHTSSVKSVAFSPDGKRIVSGSWDKTVKVWDAHTGQQTLILKGHTAMVESVAFSLDGKRIVSGGARNDSDNKSYGEVKAWDAQTGKETLSLKELGGGVFGVALSPDGKRIVSGSLKEAKVWDADTGQQLLSLKGHTGTVLSVAFSPDGKRIASAGGFGDNTVKVWDAATGQEALTLTGHSGAVFSVAFSPDGKRIASGSQDSTVRVWDAQTGQEALTLTGHTSWVHSVTFSPDGKRIASASWGQNLKTKKWGGGGQVKVWDAHTGQEILSLKGHTGFVHSVAFSPDDNFPTSRSGDGANSAEVQVWRVDWIASANHPFRSAAQLRHALVPCRSFVSGQPFRGGGSHADRSSGLDRVHRPEPIALALRTG